jgi:hypothetical protein
MPCAVLWPLITPMSTADLRGRLAGLSHDPYGPSRNSASNFYPLSATTLNFPSSHGLCGTRGCSDQGIPQLAGISS